MNGDECLSQAKSGCLLPLKSPLPWVLGHFSFLCELDHIGLSGHVWEIGPTITIALLLLKVMQIL